MTSVAEVLGRRRPFVPVPNFAMGIAGSFGAFAARFDAHRFAGLDPKVLTSMQQERYRTGEKMMNELGIKPRPVVDSIEEAYRWFTEFGYC